MHSSLQKLALVKNKVNEIISQKQLKTNPTIIVISKTFSLEKIKPLMDNGHTHFGENKIQEAENKWSEVINTNKSLQLHMVGKLQSNKAKKAVKLFMRPLNKVIINKDTSFNPIWIMRQAGRYLPEFREIRKENPNFINLCLNDDLSSKITLQPLKRFELDAAIIFSDILMLPYGLGQKVEFEKNFGPKLGKLNLNEIAKIDEVDFLGNAIF